MAIDIYVCYKLTQLIAAWLMSSFVKKFHPRLVRQIGLSGEQLQSSL